MRTLILATNLSRSAMHIVEGVKEKQVGNVLILAPLDESGLPDTEHAFCLEGVAKDIWQLLRRGFEYKFILETLTEEYIVNPETLAKDVDDFLYSLESHGLIAR